MRAGAQTLTLLGAPRNSLILQTLADGPRGLRDLRRAAGSPAQSTLRGHVRTLEAAGAVVKRRRDSFPGALEYELTGPGRELLAVAAHLDRWLGQRPSGPLELGGDPGRAAVKGLVDGWLARMLAPLATGPLSLTELDKRLNTVSYPTIERRLETMRLIDQVEVGSRTGAGTPYALTPWMRRGVAPLAIAASWEHRHEPPDSEPLTRLEVDSALKLAMPLLKLDPSISGVCECAVRMHGKRRTLAVLEVRRGDFVPREDACPTKEPDAWLSGPPEAWFTAVIDGNLAGLRVDGDTTLAAAVIGRPHEVLFAEPAAAIVS